MNRAKPGRNPYVPVQEPAAPDQEKQFDELEASSLFCPKCKAAVPVRKRLLLVLPEGERYEYLCAYCSTSVGRKIEEVKNKIQLIYTR
jgi:hypothetical protein